MSFINKFLVSSIYRGIVELKYLFDLIKNGENVPTEKFNKTYKLLNETISELKVTEINTSVTDTKENNFIEFGKYIKNKGAVLTEDDVNEVYDSILKILHNGEKV